MTTTIDLDDLRSHIGRTQTATDVVLRGNTARVGSGLFSTRKATLTWRDLSRPASTGPILFDDVNATGGVPKDRVQILGAQGDIQETRVVKIPVSS